MLEIDLKNLLSAAYIIIPAYLANATPLIFGGGKAIDFDMKFLDGERIFGTNKTIRGFLSGFLFGVITALILYILVKSYSITACFLIPIGSLCGDLAGAFVKRRLKLGPGFPLPLLDQLDFIFGALLLSYPLVAPSIEVIFIILLVTPPTHLITNTFAYLLKIKKNYW
ncbi:CDP-2,3-bis-(O-geranylgeranyl)-sn-glycerol synthase [[Eubacterium] cellulosolvens]